MFTLISSRISLDAIQKNFLSASYFSDTGGKYAKITALVLTVLAAFVTIVCVYRSLKSKALKKALDEESDIPLHIAPKTGGSKMSPSDKEEVIKTGSPHSFVSPSLDPKVDRKDHENDLDLKKTDIVPPSKQQELDDEEYAKQLQNKFNQALDEESEDLDDGLLKALQADAEAAQQTEFDAEEDKSPKGSPSKSAVSTTPVKDPAPVTPTDPATKDLKPAKPSPFTQIEKICAEISEKAFTDSSFSAVTAIKKGVDSKTNKQVLDLLNEIVAEFERRYPLSQKVSYGAQVPAYFANVAEQSEHDRKYLSLVGIRNLLVVGPQIIDDFRDTKFLGGEHHYAAGKGLHAFKYYTGNVVDLDTEFEAPNDSMAQLRAKEMIVKFGQICGIKKPGLTADEVASLMPHRKLTVYWTVPVSVSNTDRSNNGLWKRSNLSGKILYYANVPSNCDVILLATLRMPYLIAELAYRTKEYNQGKLPKEFFDEFFEKGVSDKCFNDEARTFMDFSLYWNAKLEGVPTVKEDARRKIKEGTFGEAIQKKGADAALKQAMTRPSLIGLLDKFDFECKKRPQNQWVEEEKEKIKNILIAEGLWKTTLYQTDEDADFFLLDEGTLNKFLKDYHQYLETSGI